MAPPVKPASQTADVVTLPDGTTVSAERKERAERREKEKERATEASILKALNKTSPCGMPLFPELKGLNCNGQSRGRYRRLVYCVEGGSKKKRERGRKAARCFCDDAVDDDVELSFFILFFCYLFFSFSLAQPPPLPSTTNQTNNQMPLATPPGVDPALAAQVIAFMKSNPQAAALAAEQARRVLATNPQMADAMLKAPSVAASKGPEYAAALEKLAEDEELGPIFTEIKEKGIEAMQKHWADTELMEKVATKMRALQVDVPGTPKRGGSEEPASKEIKKPVSSGISNGNGIDLHALAKAGDAKGIAAALAANNKKKDGGDADDSNDDGGREASTSSFVDPNARDARGITPLGIAVGYNRLDAVKVLLAEGTGVDVDAGCDSRRSTALHFASGYGRLEIVDFLLERGADPKAVNAAGQTPLDVATVNREMKAVKRLQKALAERESKEDVFV